jgi:hypothetical protein
MKAWAHSLAASAPAPGRSTLVRMARRKPAPPVSLHLRYVTGRTTTVMGQLMKATLAAGRLATQVSLASVAQAFSPVPVAHLRASKQLSPQPRFAMASLITVTVRPTKGWELCRAALGPVPERSTPVRMARRRSVRPASLHRRSVVMGLTKIAMAKMRSVRLHHRQRVAHEGLVIGRIIPRLGRLHR